MVNCRAFVYEGFLTDEECNHLISLEFELRLKQVFCIYDIEEMVIRMADRVWTVPIDDLCLDAQIFSNFVAALQLQFLDYLLVIMLSTVEF
ncbi:hypothetical protein RHGRI_034062 [Rhododendron griersonianum]|uniref:Uncharacterized protein n=1 Tax=Rhododendron griersonianum TaxID=479676 RepID=A0AAV6I4Y0_9ERIC|nr:hypothetical protein RHGRI_034062 [Rhododendron griersonianum]